MGCDADNVGVQLYVNQLPGVSIENISSLVDDEQETYLSMWEDIVLRTLKKFVVLIKSKINKCYKITDNSVIECLICENVELFDVALWYLHGTELMIERTSTDTLNRYTTIDLDKANELKAEFYTEAIASLEDAVSSINVANSDCINTGCVECNDAVKFVLQTP